MIAAAAQPAAAQTADAGATSQSINQTQVLVGSGAGGGTLKYDGSYSVKTNPDVVPPMLPGGANPCVVAASAGGSVVGFGMAGGVSWNDPNCERRNLAIVLMNASAQFQQPHLASAAVEVLCANEEVEEAMRLVGTPCIRTQQTQQVSRTGAQTASAGTSDFDWIENPQVGR